MTFANAFKLGAAALALSVLPAHALLGEAIIVRVGAIQIAPQVESGSLSGPAPSGSTIDNGASTRFAGGITTVFTDNITLDLPLAPPFKFPIYATGSVQGAGLIGTVKSLPATNYLQYRFFDKRSVLRPYVGLGVTYAYFFDPEGSAALSSLTNPGGKTTFRVKSKFAPSVQVGASLHLGGDYYLDASYGKTYLKTTTTLSTGQTQEAKLDPVSFSLGIGQKF